jgi:hypothetical protein
MPGPGVGMRPASWTPALQEHLRALGALRGGNSYRQARQERKDRPPVRCEVLLRQRRRSREGPHRSGGLRCAGRRDRNISPKMAALFER